MDIFMVYEADNSRRQERLRFIHIQDSANANKSHEPRVLSSRSIAHAYCAVSVSCYQKRTGDYSRETRESTEAIKTPSSGSV